MTKVAVIAGAQYPAEFRLLIQKQTSNDGVTWVDGDQSSIAPGGRTNVNVSAGSMRAKVSGDNAINMNATLQFGGGADVRFVYETFNGEQWSDYTVFEAPNSPFPFDVMQGMRLRIEGK